VPGYTLTNQQQLLQELSAALLLRLPGMALPAAIDSTAALAQLMGAPQLSLQQMMLTQQQQQQQQQQQYEAVAPAGQQQQQQQQGGSSSRGSCYWAALLAAVVEGLQGRLLSSEQGLAVQGCFRG
jgi:hypothetical protein